ncbi:DUF6745 domain-containing protein [Kitasatospora cineracea]|uniref:DUF6745 domain-containing protein n=1 Tax=Kitasatospora cineracea TaxID=88074 RepID=A0A3N4RIQ9_9ACTN|nr:hypothetical protein [Kitasatospora cineracea]ROR42131.1 hypothetical protein EDD39_0246 [Kitasatospora cineracea]RPE32646.1 hypothetical protein EDD38_0913 [Kitasatospora cineracea]
MSSQLTGRPADLSVAHWRAVAAATGPADRATAEQAVRDAYRAAGLAEPAEFRWCPSPRAAVDELLAHRDEFGASVREQVRTAAWERARTAALAALGPAGWSALWAVTGAELATTTALPAERVRAALLDHFAPEPEPIDDWQEARKPENRAVRQAAAERRGRIRLLLLDAVAGQHDAAWLAAFDTAGTGDAALAALAGAARQTGWWWPYERTVLLSERPTALHRDEAGRLDRADGPALAYADGFALHAWRGMPVPADFLDRLTGLTPERIRGEENAELRRVMLEHFGYDRYLAESGAEPLHRDATGTLWRIQLPNDEPVVMVEVLNSTPEPDGTHRTYYLRVPPGTRTARAGVAWTFGVEEAEYHPQQET